MNLAEVYSSGQRDGMAEATALRERGGPSQCKLAMRMEEMLLKENGIERWYLASSPRAL